MIVSFQHKGLESFFFTGSSKDINAQHANKLRIILTALDAAGDIRDMNLPAFRLHELKGSRKGVWSVTVNGPWRVTFRFVSGNAEIVNYEQYH